MIQHEVMSNEKNIFCYIINILLCYIIIFYIIFYCYYYFNYYLYYFYSITLLFSVLFIIIIILIIIHIIFILSYYYFPYYSLLLLIFSIVSYMYLEFEENFASIFHRGTKRTGRDWRTFENIIYLVGEWLGHSPDSYVK